MRRSARPGHRAPTRLAALLAALAGALALGAGPGLATPAWAQDANPPVLAQDANPPVPAPDANPPSVWAHGGDAPDGTNYRTAVRAVTPAVPGLTVRAVEAGARLELTNRTGRTIEVLGYQGEPYLEVRPDGVYENVNSPATYLNRTLAGDTEPPASADPTVPPNWRQVTTEPVARWHDQRTYWLGTDPPPEVRADPDRSYLVRDWVVPLRDQLAPVEIQGTLEWLPPPDPLLWWAGIVLAALALAALGLVPVAPRAGPAVTAEPRPAAAPELTPAVAPERTPAAAHRTGPAAAATVGLAAFAVLAGAAAVTFALLREVDAGATGFGVVRGLLSGQLLPVLAGAGSLVTGAYVLVRRPAGGDFGLALSGACVAIFAGVVNATVLARSVAPIGWPAGWARLLVALVIAVGAGVCAAGVLRMWAAVRSGPPSAADPSGADPSGADPSAAGPAGGGHGGVESVR
jgi:hypothetical protein